MALCVFLELWTFERQIWQFKQMQQSQGGIIIQTSGLSNSVWVRGYIVSEQQACEKPTSVEPMVFNSGNKI